MSHLENGLYHGIKYTDVKTFIPLVMYIGETYQSGRNIISDNFSPPRPFLYLPTSMSVCLT